MAPRTWYWAYFVRGGGKYQKNNSNFEAYCRERCEFLARLSNVLVLTHRLYASVPQDKDVNLLALWSALSFPGTTNTDQLACLAKLLLLIVANSASAERLFSGMGNIHTKRRSRLHYKKVHDLATAAMDLDAQHQATGISCE
jgi:hypothetical protein